MHKTSARPLALVYAALIVYASLYPFTDWRNQGIAPWSYLSAPLPIYWTGFDVVSNVLGYMPMGFLLVIAAMRSGRFDSRLAVLKAILWCTALSFTMETLQSYLPVRVASNLDLMLNSLGGACGAGCAYALERWGVVARWSTFRKRWFVPEARWVLVLLALWPLALLFPASVPFGLGQILERAEPAALGLLGSLPGLQALTDYRTVLQPMQPATELLCVILGALAPCLLGYCVIRSWTRRLVFLFVALAVGVAMTALSAALSYGPTHAWAWLNATVLAAGLIALVFGVLMSVMSARASATALLLVMVLHLTLLNLTPMGAYFSQTLQTWEQGRFIRFHGLAQWLGWLWPYAALLYVVHRVSAAGGRQGYP